MLAESNDFHTVDNRDDILKEPWDKAKKYELVERRLNTPTGYANDLKLPVEKRVFELSNRMATHYKSFAGITFRSTLARLVKLEGVGTLGVGRKQPSHLPDFPQFRRIVNRSRRKKDKAMK